MATPTVAQTNLQDHPAFYATVGQVATCARLKLPDSVARIERALQIVYHDGVTLLADGTALVQSQTDPDVEYQVNGHCCCQDALYAPDHICKHLAASWIYRRVQQRLATLDLQETMLAIEECPVVLDEDAVPCHAVYATCPHAVPPAPPMPFPEAMASVNVRILIQGRECQWTLRSHDEVDLAVRLEALLQRFPKN